MKKIPIVKQRDLKDCGPCCLLSILKFYKGYIPLENIRNDCYTNINGTTAYHLISSLKKYGFDSYGIQIEKNELNNDLILPAIAHLKLSNGLNHFVVIYKINNKTLTIMDPYKGIVKMSHEKFFEIFTGIIIICYPKGDSIMNYESLKINEFIFKLLKNNKSLFIKILFSGVLVIIFTILNGLYFKVEFNNIDNKTLTKLFSILFLFFIISKILFEYLSSYYKNYLIKDINCQLNKEFFENFFKLPSKIVKNRSSGEIITRVIELNNLHEIISDIIISTIINLFLAITTFIVLYFISFQLLKILILFTSIFILICILSNKTIYRIIKENIESNENFNNAISEYCNAFESIKNNNIENMAYQKIQNINFKYLKSNFKINKSINKVNTPKNFLIDIMHFAIITVGFYLIAKNKLSLVNFITFEAIFAYLVDPIKEMMTNIPKLNYLKASLEKIMEFMTLPVENLNKRELFLNGNIEIDNLNYSYNDYNNVLSNVNLIIEENSHVMIKGISGTGKSTFCKLLNRTYNCTNGNININGININDYSLKTIRNNILYLSQNEFLFDDTIKNNIILDCKFNINKFNYICKICHLEEIVDSKPLRYETYINKNFANLSGGEKQRIILARALYRDFKILILDEALSEVNSDLEIDIIKRLDSFLSHKTLIYVSHKDHEKYFNKVLQIGEK